MYDIGISPDNFEDWPHTLKEMLSWAFEPASDELLLDFIGRLTFRRRRLRGLPIPVCPELLRQDLTMRCCLQGKEGQMLRHGLLQQLFWTHWSQEQAKRPLQRLSSKGRTMKSSSDQSLQCMRRTRLLQAWCKARLQPLLPVSFPLPSCSEFFTVPKLSCLGPLPYTELKTCK